MYPPIIKAGTTKNASPKSGNKNKAAIISKNITNIVIDKLKNIGIILKASQIQKITNKIPKILIIQTPPYCIFRYFKFFNYIQNYIISYVANFTHQKYFSLSTNNFTNLKKITYYPAFICFFLHNYILNIPTIFVNTIRQY